MTPRWRWSSSTLTATASRRWHSPSAGCWAFSSCRGSRPSQRSGSICLSRAAVGLPEPRPGPGTTDRLGPHRPAVRRDGALRDRHGRAHGRPGDNPAALYSRQRPTPDLPGLSELGKAAKTVFLCRYLGEAALRGEIHEGLNVVETWNSANDFIFFGNGGEVASNRLEDQEISVHALHLLQSCLVYVNTLMLQRVLAEPAWMARMMPADLRALTPLVWGHVSPYGAFDLDMKQRLDLDILAVA
jgi:Tn3 transposase DDE domain